MARFDVYRNPNRRSRDRIPYLLDIQANLLGDLATCLVVPLVPASEFGLTLERLNPVLRLGGRNYVMATTEMASISRKGIGERAGTLEAQAPDILAAVDFLLSGF